mmetsp:Transcript_5155/g.5286  ORF Transcript_5155/g.5286 Transcript_5155/m.5286 type:complete len:153 (+) Transcript_5155:107-565(+)
MSADGLTTVSRSFYERARLKIAVSIILGAASMMLLGFTASSAGEAAFYANLRQGFLDNNAKDDSSTVLALDAKIAGYGFGAFVYVLAGILLFSAAVYVSPFFCGTRFETRIIKSPQEIDQMGGATPSNNGGNFQLPNVGTRSDNYVPQQNKI